MNVADHLVSLTHAARLLAERAGKPYQYIVVDEAQDLSPWQWRMLRAVSWHGHPSPLLPG